MFALNLNVIFHLCPATEGWILDMSRKQIYGEGIWGTLKHVQLDMIVISGKCKLSFYALKKALFISLTLVSLQVSAGILIFKSF